MNSYKIYIRLPGKGLLSKHHIKHALHKKMDSLKHNFYSYGASLGNVLEQLLKSQAIWCTSSAKSNLSNLELFCFHT